MNPTVISFFTNDWEYPKYAKSLTQDCIRLNLDHHIVEKQTTGNYKLNCNIKPEFILETINNLKRPVLWVDVDCSIMKYPELLAIDPLYDLALNKTPWNDNRWSVGHIYVNFTPTSINFIQVWIDHTKSTIDHIAFDRAIEEHNNLRIFELPPEYFSIMNNPNNKPDTSKYFVHRLSKSPSKLRSKKEY